MSRSRRDLLKAASAAGLGGAIRLPGGAGDEPSIFRDVAAEVGLNFRYYNFANGHHYMPRSWSRVWFCPITTMTAI